MAVTPTIAKLLALRMQLLDNGWNVVPSSPSDKKCYVVGWPGIETNEFHLDSWTRSFPAHTNTSAVGNRNYFGVDIDVLSDPDLAHRIQALAFEHLGITPFLRVGLWPKRLLVYRKRPEIVQPRNSGRDARICTPVIQSVSYKAVNGDGIEILSTGRQFTIYGFHYEAGQPYRWIGEANPLDDRPHDAPRVTQKQVDTFLAAVEEIIPRTSASSGHGGNGGDATRHVNAEGLIDDGRESYLRDCIWAAAHEIEGALTAQGVASRGWELFEERAWNGDDKYCLDKQAIAKARLLIRRLGDGRAKLGGTTRAATPTFIASGAKFIDGKRDKLRARFCELISTAHLFHLGSVPLQT